MVPYENNLDAAAVYKRFRYFFEFFFKLRYSDIISMIYDLYSIRLTKLVRSGWKSWNLNIQSNRKSGHRAVTIAQKSYVGDYN